MLLRSEQWEFIIVWSSCGRSGGVCNPVEFLWRSCGVCNPVEFLWRSCGVPDKLHRISTGTPQDSPQELHRIWRLCGVCNPVKLLWGSCGPQSILWCAGDFFGFFPKLSSRLTMASFQALSKMAFSLGIASHLASFQALSKMAFSLCIAWLLNLPAGFLGRPGLLEGLELPSATCCWAAAWAACCSCSL